MGLVELIGRLPLEGIPRIGQVQVNAAALLFTAGLALATGILFGLMPALRAHQMGLTAGLGGGTRGIPADSNRRLDAWLVGAQVALSLVLLIGAGLVLKSFVHLLAVNPGFRPESLLTLRLSLSGQEYPGRSDAAVLRDTHRAGPRHARGPRGGTHLEPADTERRLG